MGFLKKNINLALVGLILILILIATATTVLYQRGLRMRTTQYEKTSMNLSECLAQVQNYREELESKEQTLNETSQDIEKYGVLYDKKVAELHATKDELAATKTSLAAMTAQKEQFKEKYSDALIDIKNLEQEKQELQDQITSLNRKIDNLRDALDACQAGGQ